MGDVVEADANVVPYTVFSKCADLGDCRVFCR